jgi:DNA-binding CsgD family transcriptional regulator
MPDGLTPQERRCVQLAGQRLRDKEIAETLGINVGTVKNHLHRAYQKLGVSDRILAARRLATLDSEGQAPTPVDLGTLDTVSVRPLSEPFGDRPSGGVTAAVSDRSEDGEVRRPFSLYRAYVSLGDWREPPRIWGSRLPLILIGALGLLVFLAVAASLMRPFYELWRVVGG